MTQTVLAMNGQDCTIGDGNTPEDYEAIAVALLRAAEATRNREEGRVECFGQDGQVLASVLIHHCGPACDEDAESAAAILGHITPRKRDAAEGN